MKNIYFTKNITTKASMFDFFNITENNYYCLYLRWENNVLYHINIILYEYLLRNKILLLNLSLI